MRFDSPPISLATLISNNADGKFSSTFTLSLIAKISLYIAGTAAMVISLAPVVSIHFGGSATLELHRTDGHISATRMRLALITRMTFLFRNQDGSTHS